MTIQKQLRKGYQVVSVAKINLTLAEARSREALVQFSLGKWNS